MEKLLEELLDAALTEWFDRDVFKEMLDAALGGVSCSSNSALSSDGNFLRIILIASETKRLFLHLFSPDIYFSRSIELTNHFKDE